MTFVKTTWVDRQVPRLTAAQLNRIEQGIADAHGGLAAVPILTALPLTAADGQEIVFQAAVDRLWRLRYVASSARWRFLGGPPVSSGPLGQLSMNSTAPTIPGNGPSLVVPATGLYRVDFGAYAEVSANGLYVVTAQLLDNASTQVGLAQSFAGGGHVSAVVEVALVVGHTLDFRLFGSVASVAYYGKDFRVALTPVYLGT